MITLISYGFKYGRPESNFMFDVSYFKNPWREKGLVTAGHNEVVAFMHKQPGFTEIVNSIANVIMLYHKQWPEENMIFAICCNAGADRSPIVADEIADVLKKHKIACVIKHNFLRP